MDSEEGCVPALRHCLAIRAGSPESCPAALSPREENWQRWEASASQVGLD